MANHILKKSEITAAFDYSEYAKIENPVSIFPEFEILPLADPLTLFTDKPKALLMDMDGTTTTTETLCLYALEDAIRKACGGQNFAGLDSETDYPNVIGNSTTKHVEYLVEKYQAFFDLKALHRQYHDSARWTIEMCRDENRRKQAQQNLRYFGLASESENAAGVPKKLSLFEGKVRACTDIYYHTYHLILNAIDADDDAFLKKIPGINFDEKLIKPMPAVAITLAIIKGDLGSEAGKLAPLFSDENGTQEQIKATQKNLITLGEYFEKNPIKVALVTSSITFEADIVMNQVFNVIREEIAGWPVSSSCRAKLNRRFTTPEHCYDAFITADDATEMRLKPHRDLYSTALQMLQIKPSDFHAVAGFEDSESGTIALRAAGVGLTVALPFLESANHNFSAASRVVKGGLPEVLLKHHLFLSEIL
ncbi:MAG: hypothetical protein EA391_04090 [Balneolaceae bacterium]|nr:MAG: hypothetical protein EA391_04090 [Balneolaceae bacterium]